VAGTVKKNGWQHRTSLARSAASEAESRRQSPSTNISATTSCKIVGEKEYEEQEEA